MHFSFSFANKDKDQPPYFFLSFTLLVFYLNCQQWENFRTTIFVTTYSRDKLWVMGLQLYHLQFTTWASCDKNYDLSITHQLWLKKKKKNESNVPSSHQGHYCMMVCVRKWKAHWLSAIGIPVHQYWANTTLKIINLLT